MRSKAELEAQIKSERSCVLFVNTHSRRGRDVLIAARESLEVEGYVISAEYAVSKPSHLARLIPEAVASCASLLVVGAGDGTISTISGYLAYRDVALGVLPLGTTNNFARNLGIPLAVDRAVQVITRGKVVDVDLGKVGDYYFANAASVGLAVEVARSISPRLKRILGKPAYALQGIRTFRSHRSFRVIVETPQGSFETRTHMFFVANGGYLGGYVIAEEATLDDRALTIFPLGDHRTARLAYDLIQHAVRRQRHVREGQFITATRARITTVPPRSVEIDGEVKTRTPIEVSVARQALRVMAPQEFVDL